MSPVIGAAVSVGNLQVSASWNESAPVALDALAIDWGRSGPWADADPATAQLRLIDPTGMFAHSEAIANGIPVRIDYLHPDLTRTVFRGAVSRYKTRREKRLDPIKGGQVVVWVIDIVAKDPTAIASGVVRGPGPDGSWPAQSARDRFNFLWPRVSEALGVSSTLAVDIAANVNVREYTSGQAPNGFELLRRTLRAVAPEAVLLYDPNANALHLQYPLGPSVIEVTDQGSLVGRTGWVGSHHGIDSRLVELVAEDVDTTAADRISSVELAFTYRLDFVRENRPADQTFTYQATVPNGEGGTVLRIDSDLLRNASDNDEPMNTRHLLMRERAVALNAVRFRHPPVALYAERLYRSDHAHAYTTRELVPGVAVSTRDLEYNRLWFLRSIFAGIGGPLGMPGHASAWGPVGGTLTYSDRIGWRHELNLAPHVGRGDTLAQTATLAQLFSAKSLTLAQLNPGIHAATLADYGTVNRWTT